LRFAGGEYDAKRRGFTGGFGALGATLADVVSQHGAQQVALIDKASAMGSGLTARALLLPGVDLSNEPETAAAIDEVAKQFGAINALVNVAGTFRWETLESGSVDTWDLMYKINLHTAVVASRAALPYLFKPGRWPHRQHRCRCRSKGRLGHGRLYRV
jgi:NAD(P)-dependent dehydrogenase (short-subunit alcohol dehydrogenase family)